MQYHLISPTLWLTLILLSACMRPTDLDPKEEPEVIVNCVLVYPKEIQEVTLCYTKSSSGIGGEAIENATVSLKDNTTGEDMGQFNHQEGGRWILPVQVVPEHCYSLIVNIPDHPTIEATTTVPKAYHVAFDPWGLSTVIEDQLDSEVHIVKTSTCYHTESLGEDPLWIYALSYKSGGSLWEMAGKIISDCQAVDPFNQNGEIIPTDALSVEERYFIGTASWERSVFGYSFFHNYYLRIPSPGTYQYEMPSVLDLPGHLQSIRQATRSSPTAFYLGLDLQEPFMQLEGTESWSLSDPPVSVQPSTGPSQPASQVVFLFCSEEYDQYLKGALSYQIRHTGNDITAIYDRSNVYGNIPGGHGIFGAYITYYLPWYPAGYNR